MTIHHRDCTEKGKPLCILSVLSVVSLTFHTQLKLAFKAATLACLSLG
jgi:hypothetical protein